MRKHTSIADIALLSLMAFCTNVIVMQASGQKCRGDFLPNIPEKQVEAEGGCKEATSDVSRNVTSFNLSIIICCLFAAS